MNLDGVRPQNNLFLVCPTDGMEPLLVKKFKEQAFFYTALGACFEWDLTTQKSLVGLIEKQDIKQITMVVKTNNNFFVDKVKIKYNLAHYPVEKALQYIEDDIPEQLEHWDGIIPKLRVLAATYLEHQKSRFLDTELLRQLVNSGKIRFESLLYDELANVFYKTEKLKRKVKFLETISIN